MKHGNTVDAETAERIMKSYRHDRDDIRAVIWPMERVIEAMKTERYWDLEQQPCQRPLAHMICDDVEIIVIAVSSYIQQGQYGMGMSYERWDYQGELVEAGAVYAFVYDEAHLRRFKEGWRAQMRERRVDPEVVELTLETCHAVKTLMLDPEKYKGELDAIKIAVQLEQYAFSPYTVYKERRTVGQMLNQGKSRLIKKAAPFEQSAQPAIEIVCLRIPEHKDKSAPTGRHISCRYEVESFTRNQWYPSEKRHKPIQVKPHVRGPEGAPLRPKRERIYKVTR